MYGGDGNDIIIDNDDEVFSYVLSGAGADKIVVNAVTSEWWNETHIYDADAADWLYVGEDAFSIDVEGGFLVPLLGGEQVYDTLYDPDEFLDDNGNEFWLYRFSPVDNEYTQLPNDYALVLNYTLLEDDVLMISGNAFSAWTTNEMEGRFTVVVHDYQNGDLGIQLFDASSLLRVGDLAAAA